MSPPATSHAETQISLHIPSPALPSGTSERPFDAAPPVDHLLLAMDTPNAQLTMRLPIGRYKRAPPREYWDRWVKRLHGSFVTKFRTSVFHRDILLNIVCLYRAFTLGRRTFRLDSDFYDAFTQGLLDLARASSTRCVKRDLALYVIDMRTLIGIIEPTLDDAPLSTLSAVSADLGESETQPADLPIAPSAPSSPSISAAADLADTSAHDSGYESSDSMPSLRTVEDSSDEGFFSDSSEDPDSDSEEDVLLAQGFVVDEHDRDSDADM